ncbi:fluoride efflux transporter FluC [Couchioplanes caeruleus]|uniref:Fluoride-specific ion channel FluC n=2 Tax=Couchioplanes caeruleus TaxID=56438 RepID=A0A1K0FMH5_9ACTN|nr:CrcB family protein [Couchioplanes caeruleus]OJF14039.1 chromosome condensation protein CrcB [Couchioplanes caeruleus subsp. caeruleus]ROP30565.1 camphor resistance protein CrcB [Couchioplanes caeruleus]
MTVLLVALGAAVGAPLRYLTDRYVRARRDSPFPWGTLIVNVAGSLLLGFLVGLPVGPALAALVGTGFCGALTTYSTFGFETWGLARTGHRFLAGAYALGSVLAGLGAASIGYLAGRAFG